MNKRTDNEELLEDVLADEAGCGVREASLENILRLARRRRRTRLVQRAGVVAALLLISALGVMHYLAPKSAMLEVAPAPPAIPGFALITSQPLTPAEMVASQPLPSEQIVTTLPLPAVVQTVAGNYREVGDDELLALAAPQTVALVRRGPHEAELVFVPAQSNPQEN